MLNATAYDTTIGMSFTPTVQAAKNAIEKVLITEFLGNYPERSGDISREYPLIPVFISGGFSDESNIPLFNHPIIVKHDQKEYICIDVRSTVTHRGDPYSYVVRNTGEYQMNKMKLLTTMIWKLQRPGILRDISDVPACIYSSWISENLQHRYSLDKSDQMKLAVIAAYFYLSRFTNEKLEVNDVAIAIKRITKVPSEIMVPVIEKMEELNVNNITDLASAIKTILENVRLEQFNSGVLITIIGNSWFNVNAKDLLSIALEHPPTWISIVFAALNERTFSKSLISKIAERYSGHRGGDNFTKALLAATEPYLKGR